ncbi:DUF1697 domain-containing protein [Glycomyces paridis]|uniref:DUF1697 domain-containing protein n=1 Tax=Glycomyces paridis TaxID=2126555 RepID=UPI001305083C|nr:DUF1697 domain-containing protein [Glycomyces paridis]
MTTYAALLRGVNVGGHRAVPMAQLREALEAAGFGRPRTYIQSGNAVVDSDLEAPAVASALKALIADRFGHTVPVMVRSAAQLAAVLAADPWPGRDLDPAKVTVTFLSEAAPQTLTVPAGRREEAHTAGTEVWVHYPDGLGVSTLDRSGFWRPLAGIDTTTRNLRTVRVLRDMAAA